MSDSSVSDVWLIDGQHNAKAVLEALSQHQYFDLDDNALDNSRQSRNQFFIQNISMDSMKLMMHPKATGQGREDLFLLISLLEQFANRLKVETFNELQISIRTILLDLRSPAQIPWL